MRPARTGAVCQPGVPRADRAAGRSPDRQRPGRHVSRGPAPGDPRALPRPIARRTAAARSDRARVRSSRRAHVVRPGGDQHDPRRGEQAAGHHGPGVRRLRPQVAGGRRCRRSATGCGQSWPTSATRSSSPASTCTIEYVNPAWERLHGYQPGEAIGQPVGVVQSRPPSAGASTARSPRPFGKGAPGAAS